MSNKFYHSVHLEKDLCKGCIHCLKRCPTEAIRVEKGKAWIKEEFCIDCSECILHCPYHAKVSQYDHLSVLNDYKYNVALVDPSLYGQFNRLTDVNIILTALIGLGFDDVFEVAYAQEYLIEKTAEYIAQSPAKAPLISSTCPSIDRLIRVRFPNLIDKIIPFISPVEIAAQAALKEAMAKTHLPEEKIGIIYISPCPAQISYTKSPLGIDTCHVDACLANKELYKPLIAAMKIAAADPKPLSRITGESVRLGKICTESLNIGVTNYLAADGIENVIRVLNDIEDDKAPEELEYVELKACSAGCVGGVLNVENPYIGRTKINALVSREYSDVDCVDYFENICGIDPKMTSEIEYEPVYHLADNMVESMQKMMEVDQILKTLPQLDCGSCGAPTCRTIAEDIVRKDPNARLDRCIYIMRGRYAKNQRELEKLTKEKKDEKPE